MWPCFCGFESIFLGDYRRSWSLLLLTITQTKGPFARVGRVSSAEIEGTGGDIEDKLHWGSRL
jgi:hypothetical protein